MLNLKNAASSRKSTQGHDVPSQFKQSLITHKVTSRFLNSLGTSISCTSFLRPTVFSRLKKILRILPLLAAIPGSCAYANVTSKLEPLYSAQFSGEYVIIEVKSTGCTRPEDFTIIAKGKGGVDYTEIGIVRKKPDRCRMKPLMIRVHLEMPGSLVALNEPYKMANLFLSKTNF